MHGVTNHTKHPLKLKFITNYYYSSGRRHPHFDFCGIVLLKTWGLYWKRKKYIFIKNLLLLSFYTKISLSSPPSLLQRVICWEQNDLRVTVLGWWPSGLPFSVFLSFCIIIYVLVLCVSLELFYWWFRFVYWISPMSLTSVSPSLCLCLCLCVYVCLVSSPCVSLHHVYLFPQPITSALFLSLPHAPSLPLVCHSSTPTSCFNVKVMCPCSVCLVNLCQLCFPVCLSVCSVYHLTV